MKKAMVSASIALALGACSQAAAPVSMCGPDCAAAMRKILPANTPSYAPIYSGGWVNSTSSYANGGVITYSVTAKPDDIVRFYDAAATSRAMTRTFDNQAWMGQASTSTSLPARVVVYAQTGTSRSLYISLDTNAPGFTRVALVYGAQ
jgi:hypothetical protein